MRNEVIRNDGLDDDELIPESLEISSIMELYQYKNACTRFIPYNDLDMPRTGGGKIESLNKFMIKKSRRSKIFGMLFQIYDNIISTDSVAFFNTNCFENQIHIVLKRMENIRHKQYLGTISEYKEEKKATNRTRFNNKKMYDTSPLLDKINIDDGKHLYFITDHIYENLDNPDCFTKFTVEEFQDSAKIITFLDLCYQQLGIQTLIKEYSRYVLKGFCGEILELSENNNSKICCFSNSTHKRVLDNGIDWIVANIFNSPGIEKTTDCYLSEEGIEFIKKKEVRDFNMYDLAKLEAGTYALNKGNVYTIGKSGRNFDTKGLQLV